MPIPIEIKCTYKPTSFDCVYWCRSCHSDQTYQVDVMECLEVMYTCKTCGSKTDRPRGLRGDPPSFVYTMTDPRTGLVIYVGCTEKPILRYQNHLAEPRQGNKPLRLFSDLQAEGVLPVMTVIDTGNRTYAYTLERKWMAHYRSLGHPLRNKERPAAKYAFAVTHSSAVNEDEEPAS